MLVYLLRPFIRSSSGYNNEWDSLVPNFSLNITCHGELRPNEKIITIQCWVLPTETGGHLVPLVGAPYHHSASWSAQASGRQGQPQSFRGQVHLQITNEIWLPGLAGSRASLGACEQKPKWSLIYKLMVTFYKQFTLNVALLNWFPIWQLTNRSTCSNPVLHVKYL